MPTSYSDIIKQCKKSWNCESLMTGSQLDRGPKIPFSSPLMNYATYGGIPRNKITEFFGEPGSGKSTSAVDVCKQAYKIFNQEFNDKVADLREKISKGNKTLTMDLEDLLERGPKKILYVDLEHSFDKSWSSTIGLRDDEIDVMQPPDVAAEEILQNVQMIIESGELGLIVLDSIPSLTTRSELEKKYGERTVASLAGLMTVFCRKIVSLLTRYETTLILINQTRDNMDNPYIVNTPGGKAIKFYACLRIHFKIGSPVDFLGNELPASTENPAGYLVNAKLVKQKSAPFDRKNASYYLMCQSGIRPDFDFAQLAVKKYSIIKKAGAWFTMCDPFTGEVITNENGVPVKVNGMAKVFDYLQNNTEYYEQIQKFILSDINGNGTEKTSEEETSLFDE